MITRFDFKKIFTEENFGSAEIRTYTTLLPTALFKNVSKVQKTYYSFSTDDIFEP